LGNAVRTAAKDIRDKYLSPPHTTEYGILFLPTEGLFAEVVRLPNIVEEIHREHRVMIAGPTTFATLLNCLQMGFRTVALAERSKEVWNLLGGVRTEFASFGTAMTAVKRKLEQAQSAVEGVEVRTRQMERKLRAVEKLTPSDATRVLEIGPGCGDASGEVEDEPSLVA
jgi:DNA recombination protein RmuC